MNSTCLAAPERLLLAKQSGYCAAAGPAEKSRISSSQRTGDKEITLPLELAKQLSDSSVLFEAIAGRALVGLFVVDHEGRFRFVSVAAAAATGYSVEELLALNSCLLLFPPADRPPIERVLKGEMPEGRCLSTFRRNDGSL